MKNVIITLCFFAPFCISNGLQAAHFLPGNNFAFTTGIPDDECLFYDGAEKICFIDFEKIQVNLKEVVITNAFGTVVYLKDVSGLPVNSILEIDMADFKHGAYMIELKSYAKSFRKSLSI